MPLWCSLDFESTGLDTSKDEPIEVGMILFSTNLRRQMESDGFFVKTNLPITEEVTKLTGITQAALSRFGYSSEDALDSVLDMLNDSDAVIGQNVIRFDKKLLESWAARHGKKVPEKLWIDTYTDLPVTVEPKSLKYLAADHGFIPSSSHAALADCETVLRIAMMHDVDQLIARAKEPTVVLQAHVSYDTNKLAKERRYRWNPDNKIWWRSFKQSDVKKEVDEAPFNTGQVAIALDVLLHN